MNKTKQGSLYIKKQIFEHCASSGPNKTSARFLKTMLSKHVRKKLNFSVAAFLTLSVQHLKGLLSSVPLKGICNFLCKKRKRKKKKISSKITSKRNQI